MLGSAAVLHSPFSVSTSNPSISRSLPITHTLNLPSLSLKSHQTQKKPRKFLTHAAENSNGNGSDSNNGVRIDTNEREKREIGSNSNNGDGEEDMKKEEGNNGRPRFNLKWADLLLDPNPDNILAVGLTGVLAWASLQILWQLFFISLAILLAALKQ